MAELLPALVSHVLPGDGVFDPPALRRYDSILGADGEMHPAPHGRPLALSGPVPIGALVWFEEGTDRQEAHRVLRCTGTGPYMVELGWMEGVVEVSSRLFHAHPAGTALVVVPDGG